MKSALTVKDSGSTLYRFEGSAIKSEMIKSKRLHSKALNNFEKKLGQPKKRPNAERAEYRGQREALPQV